MSAMSNAHDPSVGVRPDTSQLRWGGNDDAVPELALVASWLDYTVNGLIIGNIYALLAVGLALIFGVSRLINFAHGSVYVVGAYVGFLAVTYLGTPLPLTMVIVVAVGALLGLGIERFGLRPLQGQPHIAPLLATIGLSFVLDQLVQLVFSPDPRALPSALLDYRFKIGGGTIGALDLVIAAIGIASAGLLFFFLRFTRLGWAVRATAQDRDAAQQMGVDVNAVNSTVFAIASGLGAVSGLLVGMYYNYIDPAMSFQATLKGVVAQVIGGVGNVPGAIAGGVLLGLVESYGIALFGTSYRNLFAFVLLVVFLVLRPNGLFAGKRQAPPEPMTGTFIAPSKPFNVPARALVALRDRLALLPLVLPNPYVLQILTNSWLYALLGLSLTLVAGTVGLVSLGHAALLAIGGYASALLAIDLGMPVDPVHPLGRPDHGGARHDAGLSVVPPARPLSLDRDLGHRRDRGPGHPQLGEPDAGADRHFGHPPAVAVRLRARHQLARSTGSPWASWSCWRRCRSACWARISAACCARCATTTSPRAPMASGSTATRRWPSPSAASPRA